VWSAPAEALPVQTADQLRVALSPGWIISGTRADGIVRIVNHGTDHAVPGSLDGDSPLYTRYGYSTVSSPLLDERAWHDPLDQSPSRTPSRGRLATLPSSICITRSRNRSAHKPLPNTTREEEPLLG
jgi:hypothetical protein